MNKVYSNLEQRIIASFYLIMPSFYPCENEFCTNQEQENLHSFIKEMFANLYNEPLLLFTELKEDYGFPSPFTAAGSGREEMNDVMRKEWNMINTLIMTIMDIGKNGILDKETITYKGKLSGRYKNLFSKGKVIVEKELIINNGKPFFRALKWFTCQEEMNIRRFATCSFDLNHDYLTPVLAPILNSEDGACEIITSWLEKRNYKKVYILDQYDKSNDYMVSYIKNINNKIEKVGYPYMGDRCHIGFSMEYRYTSINPCFCTIRIQKMKEILNDFDELPIQIQKFIISTNKKCDNCRYCIQTDKTNTRPKAFLKKEYEGKTYLLCPYYPGFNYSFRDLTKEKAETIIEFIEIIEKRCLK